MRVCGGCVVRVCSGCVVRVCGEGVCVRSCSELLLFVLCRHYVVKGPEETPYFGKTGAELAS